MIAAWLAAQVHAGGLLVLLGFLYLPPGLRGAPEFEGYLEMVLKNHTASACEGGQLGVTCPHKTSISVLSAFYGRRVPSQNLCPSPTGNLSDVSEDTFCSSPVAIQKVLDECQDQRFCQFSVNSRMFGVDPCPGTFKYLIVSYKCKPDNHRVRTVCEDEKLHLHCRSTSVLAVYSASFGRPLRGSPECVSGPEIVCLSPVALRKVSRKCHRKQNCTILADAYTFGDPCFLGVKKELSVSYTCVPRQLLEEVGRDSPDPFALSDYTHGGWYAGPRLSRLHEEVMILTSSLAVFAHIWAGQSTPPAEQSRQLFSDDEEDLHIYNTNALQQLMDSCGTSPPGAGHHSCIEETPPPAQTTQQDAPTTKAGSQQLTEQHVTFQRHVLDCQRGLAEQVRVGFDLMADKLDAIRGCLSPIRDHLQSQTDTHSLLHEVQQSMPDIGGLMTARQEQLSSHSGDSDLSRELSQMRRIMDNMERMQAERMAARVAHQEHLAGTFHALQILIMALLPQRQSMMNAAGTSSHTSPPPDVSLPHSAVDQTPAPTCQPDDIEVEQAIDTTNVT